MSMKFSCCLFRSTASSIFLVWKPSIHFWRLMSVRQPRIPVTEPSSPRSGYAAARIQVTPSTCSPSISPSATKGRRNLISKETEPPERSLAHSRSIMGRSSSRMTPNQLIGSKTFRGCPVSLKYRSVQLRQT